MRNSNSNLVGIGYFVAVVLVLFPLIDLVANLWPLDPGRVNWRYGAYVLLSGFVLTMLLGTALGLFLAKNAHHRRTAKAIAVVSGVAGLVVLVAAVMFSLDALQLRASVTGDARTQFGIGIVKALVKNTLAALGLLWIAVVGWRGGRKGTRSSSDGNPSLLSR